jgi:hypothetical protein
VLVAAFVVTSPVIAYDITKRTTLKTTRLTPCGVNLVVTMRGRVLFPQQVQAARTTPGIAAVNSRIDTVLALRTAASGVALALSADPGPARNPPSPRRAAPIPHRPRQIALHRLAAPGQVPAWAVSLDIWQKRTLDVRVTAALADVGPLHQHLVLAHADLARGSGTTSGVLADAANGSLEASLAALRPIAQPVNGQVAVLADTRTQNVPRAHPDHAPHPAATVVSGPETGQPPGGEPPANDAGVTRGVVVRLLISGRRGGG